MIPETNGFLEFYPRTGYAGNDSLTYQVTDSHNARSNIAKVSIGVNPNPEPSPGSICLDPKLCHGKQEAHGMIFIKDLSDAYEIGLSKEEK